MLGNRDYTLILDASGSMGIDDQQGGKSRWEAAEEGTLAISRKLQQYDEDGITVYTFGSGFKKFENVTDKTVNRIFKEVEPNGGTNLAGVLEAALGDYFNRKAQGKTKADGEIIVCVTDGEPNCTTSAKQVIAKYTQKMDRDEELGISFLQIGNDDRAKAFLTSLDDDLVPKFGAKFDIVDALTMDEVGNRTISEVLLAAIND